MGLGAWRLLRAATSKATAHYDGEGRRVREQAFQVFVSVQRRCSSPFHSRQAEYWASHTPQWAWGYTLSCQSWRAGVKANMSRVMLPEPDRAILARRESIVADLTHLVGAHAIIADEIGRRAYEVSP